MSSQRVLAIVQVRLASRRLPQKALADIGGRPLIAHVVERAQAIRGVDAVAVATVQADQKAIRAVLTDVAVFAWPDLAEDDVLARVQKLAVLLSPDVVLRICGDCPLLLPEACEQALSLVNASGFSASEHDDSGWPDGTGAEAFTERRLRHADPPDVASRQHFTRLFGPPTLAVNPHPERIAANLSVNTPEDLDRVRRVMAHLEPGDYSWTGLVAAVEKAGL